MRKRVCIAMLVGIGLLVLVAAGLFALYRASQQVPEFYRRALAADPARQKKASEQMIRQTTALLSDANKQGRWSALFTAEQVNGWLAVDLVENHPDLLPTTIRDPRVAIEPDHLALGCRFQQGLASSVVSLVVEPYLQEKNVLALRIRQPRAGVLPIPLSDILEGISQAARQSNIRLRWRQAEGDPVAVIEIPPLLDQNRKRVQIDTLRLGQGEIYVAGTTSKVEGGE